MISRVETGHEQRPAHLGGGRRTVGWRGGMAANRDAVPVRHVAMKPVILTLCSSVVASPKLIDLTSLSTPGRVWSHF